jgi:predicted dehydrogenase
VVGVIDPDEMQARKRLTDEENSTALFYRSIPDLMSQAKPCGVIVGTRCDSHARIAIALERFGVPILLEKPVATSMAGALKLHRAYAKSKTPVVVSFPLRLTPLFQAVQEKLKAGAVGRIEHILAVNYVTYGDVYFCFVKTKS